MLYNLCVNTISKTFLEQRIQYLQYDNDDDDEDGDDDDDDDDDDDGDDGTPTIRINAGANISTSRWS